MRSQTPIRHRSWLRGAGLATWVALALGANCGPKLIKSLSPADGAVITTFSFQISIELGSAADPSTLEVELNDQDITAQLTGGPSLFVATIDPGAPLLDDNTLEVRVKRPDPEQPGANVVRTFQYLPPKARAALVGDAGECPTGPLAHCSVGDLLLSNTEARFVVQKADQRDLHFTGTFGGNLIDAEPVVGGVPQGNDNFFEFQPMLNIETVVNATSVEIVNDGQDGTPAIVRSCGPDDLLDDINPSSVVIPLTGVFPPGVDDQDYEIEACTEFRLEPLTRVVEVVTTIENMEVDDLPLYIGDYMNAAGELEQWTPIQSGLNNAGVGEIFVTPAIQAMAFYGFDDAEGRDYSLIFPLPPESALPSSSFTQSGVSAVLWGHSIPGVLGLALPPNFTVLGASSASFRRWFSVGDGSGGNAISAFSALQSLPRGTLKGCVTVGGNPLPSARVLAGLVNTSGNLRQVRSHWVTGADGCYEGVVPAATYRVAAAKEGYPYEGGGANPALHVVSVTDGGTVVQDVELPATARLHVTVVDHASAPVPARVGVVGFDPSPELNFTGSVAGIGVSSNAFYDVNADRVPTGLTRTEYTNASGIVEFDLEPGDYQVAVSRGTEWSLYTTNVTVSAGSTTNVNAQIAHVLDTTGFVSSDYHVHMIESPDSRIGRRSRVQSFAGEGVDNLIATDHAYVTNLMPDIAALGFGAFLHSTPGEEITTFDYGHFNAYPQGPDADRIQTQGSTDHSGAAPAGEDFPANGHYNLSPAQIEAAVLSDPDNAGLETVVQINHIDSHFDPLRIDTSLTPPASVLDPGDFDPESGLPTPANPLFFRLDPSIPNFFHAFPALELWNGVTIGHQDEFLVGRIGIWMNLLNQGIATTAIADTDTHEYHNLRSGGARTWTPSSTDAPAAIVDTEIGQAVKAGKGVGGQGLYVQARLLATDGSGGVADFTLGGSTQVTVSNQEVQLEIRVQAPAWAPYDRIEIYRNASTQVTQTNGGTPTLFTAVPTSVLTAGPDFSVSNVPVNGSSRLETLHTVTYSGLTQDAWFVVIVKGTQGVSPPMFPAQPSNLSLAENPTLADLTTVTAAEQGIRALGATNALYVDVDGNGEFDPPGVSVVP
jgi:hypothetical protein